MPVYPIRGCEVHFPHQAYGVQLSFMNKVISALEGGHNALLEAPTGSGKTLSLLCSALAWQVREKQRIEDGLAAEKAAQEAGADPIDGSPGREAGGGACCGGSKGCGSRGCSPGSRESPGKAPHSGASGSAGAASPGDGGFLPAGEGGQEEQAPPARRKPPKIFYATRTHSQIAQVVKELKRSGFRPRMAVLGSRKHYCINMHATRQGSIDEACEELLKEGKCQYFKNVHSFVSSGHKHALHDIEDLKASCKSSKACPYYTARKWAEEAELIFAPYSYLIDPVIRRAMGVDVEGAMLIFDEAHNIEDVCREAASVDLDLQTMLEVLICFRKAAELNGKPEVYAPLADCAEKIVGWMRDKESGAVAAMGQQRRQGGGGGRGGGGGGRYQEPYERLFPQQQLLGELTACGLGPDEVDPLWEAYQSAREEEEAMNAGEGPGGAAAAAVGGKGRRGDGKENKADAGPSAAPSGPPKDSAVRVGALALGVMSRLIQVVRMVHQVSDDGARDYRLVVQRAFENEPGMAIGGRYKAKASADEGTDALLPGFSFRMSLWSMNPAVAFRLVAEPAHSVVLTSGTLAPLDGFASELGTPFAITLEAPHVVDMKRQVWAGVVGTGPGGTPLVATYKNQTELAFQDSVGRMVLDAAASIPDGLLVFLPSYSLLDRLLTRWKASGALKRLGELKRVVQEPRGGGQDALKKTMQEYYRAIQSGGGAVFFAVCRGKVSEGLDFADGNARGVIIVGIPFPHARDLKVNEKKGFNDRGQRSLGLVSGDTWYSQQAFRALNQALGRCIRHRLDWGAILMVDERFKQPRNQRMLSRWVRGALAVHPSFEAGLASMQNFFHAIAANPPAPPAAAARPGDDASGLDGGVAAAVAARIAEANQKLAALQQAQQGGQAEMLPAGRGFEGALGTLGAGGGAQSPFDMWQGKPLGQARVAAQQQQQKEAAAQAAAAARWANHPVMLAAVKREAAAGGMVLPQAQPHQRWPQQQQPLQPAVKQEQQAWQPGPAGHQQQQQQQQTAVKQEPQQQHWGGVPGPPARPGSGDGSAAALQAAVGQAPLAAWARADVADFLATLRGMGFSGSHLPSGYSSLDAVATDSVKEAFDAARDYLADGRGLACLAAEWTCMLPRGVQAVLAATGVALPEGKPRDLAAWAFGEQQLRRRPGWEPGALLAAMVAAYQQHLEALRAGLPAPGGSSSERQQQQGQLPSAQQQPAQGPAQQQAAQQQQGQAGGSGGAAAPAERPSSGGPGSPRWQARSQAMQSWQRPSSGSSSKEEAAPGAAPAPAGFAPGVRSSSSSKEAAAAGAAPGPDAFAPGSRSSSSSDKEAHTGGAAGEGAGTCMPPQVVPPPQPTAAAQPPVPAQPAPPAQQHGPPPAPPHWQQQQQQGPRPQSHWQQQANWQQHQHQGPRPQQWPQQGPRPQQQHWQQAGGQPMPQGQWQGQQGLPPRPPQQQQGPGQAQWQRPAAFPQQHQGQHAQQQQRWQNGPPSAGHPAGPAGMPVQQQQHAPQMQGRQGGMPGWQRPQAGPPPPPQQQRWAGNQAPPPMGGHSGAQAGQAWAPSAGQPQAQQQQQRPQQQTYQQQQRRTTPGSAQPQPPASVPPHQGQGSKRGAANEAAAGAGEQRPGSAKKPCLPLSASKPGAAPAPAAAAGTPGKDGAPVQQAPAPEKESGPSAGGGAGKAGTGSASSSGWVSASSSGWGEDTAP